MTIKTAYAKTGSNHTKGGCGCGGRGSRTTGSFMDTTCECHEGLVTQPHFFSGQLLTDDDLQALTNYTLTKHRLHNRFVVGSGVSCGLAVTCHPCGGGKVIVQPGYAIDCCGNDIYVPCPVELDINAMVRDLKFKHLGHDCGDPCTDPAKVEGEQKKTGDDCGDPADRYCLYLHYCEIPDDPVTPFTQDESCTDACHPTRLHEGFRFELRCPGDDEQPPSFLDRLDCCIGELKEADHQAWEFGRSQFQMERAHTAMQAYRMEMPAEFSDEDAALVHGIYEELSNDAHWFQIDGEIDGIEISGHSSETIPPKRKGKGDKKELTEEDFRRILDRVQTLGAAIARYEMMRDGSDVETVANSVETSAEIDKIDTKISKAHDLLEGIVPAIKEQKGTYLTSQVELAAADALTENTIKYINPELTLQDRISSDAYLYAYNTISSPNFNSAINSVLTGFKSWLLRKMHQCPPTTVCGLIQEVEAVVIPTEAKFNDTALVAIDTLARAFLRYLLDCICSALIPPCPLCEDHAVKLACLEVIDCNVDNICNLERTFLLTEHNLRYWLPLIHQFGEALESICCTFSKRLDRPLRMRDVKDDCQEESAVEASQSLAQGDDQKGYFSSGGKISNFMEDQPAFPHILRLAGLKPDMVRSTGNLGNSLFNLARRQPQVTGLFKEKVDSDAVLKTGDGAMESVMDHPLVKAAVRSAAKKHMGEMVIKIESIAAEYYSEMEGKQERINERIRYIEAEMSKRPTVGRLSSTKAIKELKAAWEKQKGASQTLEARLWKLEKELKK